MFNITSNKLKIIAIISMIIDHFGYYYSEMLPIDVYYGCRIIGRIAMPIFVFLIVKGYFNTKDLKRYLIRLFRLAVTTQFVITILGYINVKYVSLYNTSTYTYLNIVFSFALVLIFIYCLEQILKNKNIIISVIGLFTILVVYKYIPLDYGYLVLILACIFYLAEKIKDNKAMYILIISMGMFMCLVIYRINPNILQVFSIFSLPFILLYNNKLGRKSVKIQKAFYSIFLIQHTVLYTIALILSYFKVI